MADVDDDCTSSTGAECGDEGTFPDWVVTTFHIYLAMVCVMGVFIALVSIIREYESWSESRDMTTRTCTRNVFVKILAGFAAACAWPVLLLFVVFWRNPRRVHRNVARRHGEDSSIDIRQHVKISTRGQWAVRGWIVMLRARHRKPLLRSSKGWGVWPKFAKRKGSNAAATAVASVQEEEEPHGQSTADGELAEAGRSGWDFPSISATVTTTLLKPEPSPDSPPSANPVFFLE